MCSSSYKEKIELSENDTLFGTAKKTASFLYEYDVFLVYDPDYDHYSAEDVIQISGKKHREQGQPLTILNFARDCPPGIPKKDFFSQSLEKCRYTCIVFSSESFQNFWMKLKVDMAIQNMIQDESKQYSLIVVVVDSRLKMVDLPLDLQTLNPILFCERYYEYRLSNAFQRLPFKNLSIPIERSTLPMDNRFPIQETSDLRQPSSCNFTPTTFNSSRDFPSSSKLLLPDYPSTEKQTPFLTISNSFHTNQSTTPHKPGASSPSTSEKVSAKETERILNQTARSYLRGRTPDEHSDFSSSSDLSSKPTATDYERQTSTLTKSCGLRQPTEMDDPHSSVCCQATACNSFLTDKNLPDAESFSQPSQTSEVKDILDSDLSGLSNLSSSCLYEAKENESEDESRDSCENIELEISDAEISPPSPSRSKSMNSLRSLFQKFNIMR